MHYEEGVPDAQLTAILGFSPDIQAPLSFGFLLGLH